MVLSFLFLEGAVGHGRLVVLLCVFCLCVSFCLFII